MTHIQANLVSREFENFELATLIVDSKVLVSNPLGDPSRRLVPVMIPKGAKPPSGWPVVLMLSGFTSNGPQSFNIKTFEIGSPDVLDRALGEGNAPRAIYAFCDAVTLWGGSQFIDSEGSGNYSSYILEELCPALIEKAGATEDANFWCAMGGSSGGYGALHLATQPTQQGALRFKTAIAIAPDCFFDASLLPDLRTGLPLVKRIGGIAKVREELLAGKLSRRKEWHTILNVIGMGHCYAPIDKGEPVWPINLETGLVLEDIWREWKRHDPLEFLKTRSATMKTRFYLDVGDRDQFQLQYGTRQVRDLLKSLSADVTYAGFEGTHFDIGERRLPAWQWLSGTWRL